MNRSARPLASSIPFILERERVLDTLLRELKTNDVLYISSPHGAGGTGLLRALQDVFEPAPFHAYVDVTGLPFVSLQGKLQVVHDTFTRAAAKATSGMELLPLLARELPEGFTLEEWRDLTSTPILLIDNLPPYAGIEARTCAKLLRTFYKHGCKVVAVRSPAAPALPSRAKKPPVVLGPQTLLLTYEELEGTPWSETFASSEELLKQTGGLVALLPALEPTPYEPEPARLRGVLRELALATINDAHGAFKLLLLAACTLGAGTFDELEHVGVVPVDKCCAQAAEFAPWLEIDAPRRRFAMRPVGGEPYLLEEHFIAQLVEADPAGMTAVAHELALRNDFKALALVLKALMAGEHRVTPFCKYVPHLENTGAHQVAGDLLEHSGASGQVCLWAKAVRDEMLGEPRWVMHDQQTMRLAVQELKTQYDLLCAIHDTCELTPSGEASKIAPVITAALASNDVFTRELAVCAQMTRACVLGDPAAALELLLSTSHGFVGVREAPPAVDGTAAMLAATAPARKNREVACGITLEPPIYASLTERMLCELVIEARSMLGETVGVGAVRKPRVFREQSALTMTRTVLAEGVRAFDQGQYEETIKLLQAIEQVAASTTLAFSGLLAHVHLMLAAASAGVACTPTCLDARSLVTRETSVAQSMLAIDTILYQALFDATFNAPGGLSTNHVLAHLCSMQSPMPRALIVLAKCVFAAPLAVVERLFAAQPLFIEVLVKAAGDAAPALWKARVKDLTFERQEHEVKKVVPAVYPGAQGEQLTLFDELFPEDAGIPLDQLPVQPVSPLAHLVGARWRTEPVALPPGAEGVARKRANVEVPPAPHIRVCLLGSLRVELDGQQLSERWWTRKKARDVLAVLALSPGHCVGRYRLATLLWGEDDLVHARNSCYSTISALRQSLNHMVGSVRPDAVLSSQTYLENSLGELLLSPSTVSVDLDEFDQVAKRVLGHRASDLEVLALCHQLVAMYGTGLAVLSLDDESIYVDTERRLKRTYLDALFEGAQTAVLLGSTKDALEFGQVALELDFTREDMCGVVMRALAMEGRFEEMRCVFSQCTQEVIATQGKPVSRELRALFAQLKEREEHVRVEAPAIEPAPKKKGRSTRGQKGTKLDVQAVRGDVDIVL